MRAQVALEYLLSYGWAILILLIAMSALYLVGPFRPEFYITERCALMPDFECKSFLMKYNESSKNVSLLVEINNPTKYTVNLTAKNPSINLSIKGFPDEVYTIGFSQIANRFDCGPSCEGDFSKIIFPGENGKIEFWKTQENLNIGNLHEIKIWINYKIEETGTNHTTAGIIHVRLS